MPTGPEGKAKPVADRSILTTSVGNPIGGRQVSVTPNEFRWADVAHAVPGVAVKFHTEGARQRLVSENQRRL